MSDSLLGYMTQASQLLIKCINQQQQAKFQDIQSQGPQENGLHQENNLQVAQQQMGIIGQSQVPIQPAQILLQP